MSSRPRRRHVHLGDRLDAIARIRAGSLSPAQAAAGLDVEAADVLRWMQIHGEDRNLTIEEVRVPPDVLRLSRRAERLVELIANAEVTIRVLDRMLAEAITAKGPLRTN